MRGGLSFALPDVGYAKRGLGAPFYGRAFKITARAEIIKREDASFASLGTDPLRMFRADFPIRNIISVEIERIFRIW